MTHWIRFSIVALTSLVLFGCGNLQRQSRTFDASGSSGITIDASQRAIITVTKDYKGGDKWQAFCAEPSPDALSALASSFGLDASYGPAAAAKVLGLATNNQDSTASIGLRTQTIQILRDSMYRLCEGYASGALSETGFSRLQRRYMHNMLALLAIEQLTGPVVAQQIALTSSSNAALGKGIGEISKSLADSAAELATAQQKLADSQTFEKSLADKTTAQIPDLADQKETAAKDTAGKNTKLKAAKIHYATLEGRLNSIEKIALNAASSASAFGQRSNGELGSSTIVSVSAEIGKIVELVVGHDYTKELCSDTLLSRGSDDVEGAYKFEVVAHMCAKVFEFTDSQRMAFLKSAQDRRLYFEKKPTK